MYINFCGLLLKKYIIDALGLILGQKQTLMQIINRVNEFTSCLSLSLLVIQDQCCEKSGPKHKFFTGKFADKEVQQQGQCIVT